MSKEIPEISPELVKNCLPAVPNDPHHKWLLAGIVSLVVSVIFLIILLAIVKSTISPSKPSPTPITDLSSPSPIPTPSPEPSFTILLMGRGGSGHDGGALTDTILLAKILLESKRVILLSIPRDLYVNIPYDGSQHWGKINTAYAIGIDQNNYTNKLAAYITANGGGELAKQVVSTLTGTSIDKYVTLDFSGFEQAIDLIGGIEIAVERAFTDYEYPIPGRERTDCAQPLEKTDQTPTTVKEEIETGKIDANSLPKLPKEFPCRYEVLRFEAGNQQMNGKTALKYVRSRHSNEEGSDFARSNRQKKLMLAVLDKLFSLNHFSKLPAFLSTLRSHVDTDLGPGDFVTWIPKANDFRAYPITSLSLTDDNYLEQGYTPDRQYVLKPLAGAGEYTAIQDWFQSHIQSNYQLSYPVIEVLYSAQQASKAGEFKKKLNEELLPVHLSIRSKSTSSASLTVLNPKILPTVIEKIQLLLDSMAVQKSATPTANTPIDLRIQIP